MQNQESLASATETAQQSGKVEAMCNRNVSCDDPVQQQLPDVAYVYSHAPHPTYCHSCYLQNQKAGNNMPE